VASQTSGTSHKDSSLQLSLNQGNQSVVKATNLFLQ